ncbi:MAG: pentapeptide repeat-containing protein [Acidimicrobiia bacterium]
MWLTVIWVLAIVGALLLGAYVLNPAHNSTRTDRLKHAMLDLGIALTTGSIVGLAVLYATDDLEKKLKKADQEIAKVQREEDNRRAEEQRTLDRDLAQERFEQAERLEEARAQREARQDNARFVRSYVGREGGPLRSLDLRGQNLDGLELHGADLSGANLTEASLYNARLIDIQMFDGVAVCTDINSADLSGGGIFVNTRFLSADLRNTSLAGANLEGAHFGIAPDYEDAAPTDLRNVDFTGVRNLASVVFDAGGVVIDAAPIGWPAEVPVPTSALPVDDEGEQCGPLKYA